MTKQQQTFHGVLNLNKPKGLTSARALDRVRRITGVRKSGHSGTLDPMATGVLVICMGRGTKLVERIMDQPKVYVATARLDLTSETLDAESQTQPVSVAAVPTESQLRSALQGFEGEIHQTPPAYSAVKVKGQPAYKLARKNKPVELKPRRVHVYAIRLLRYSWPELDFELSCGRGTYVRSLVRDLGERLGTGGCLTQLQRQAIGPFQIGDAVTLEELERAPLASVAIDIENAVTTLAQQIAGGH